jgi:ABC-2 type transport system permease protein
MNLWRLEWLRLVRTHRLLILLGVYVFFGLTGPLTARYLAQILGRLGTNGIKVEFPAPTPADGIDQFVGNASQIGLLVVFVVAGSALSFDARREMAVFLRTRVQHVRQILAPAYLVNTAAAVAALVAGTLAAWYETAVLLGPLPAGRLLLGIGLGALFLAFAVATVALAAALVRSTVAAAGLALGAVLVLGIIGSLGAGLGRWLPTRLLGAMTGLIRDGAPSDYLPATVVTALAIAGALIAAGASGPAASSRQWLIGVDQGVRSNIRPESCTKPLGQRSGGGQLANCWVRSTSRFV